MNRPLKRSIAVVVRNGDLLLSVRRPDTDDELPGIWGLPAGSFRERETVGDLIRRIGRDKLGVKLTPVRRLAGGTQERHRYRLDMELWEAEMHEQPGGVDWKWAGPDALEPGRERGSLCCDLALRLP